MKRNSIFFRRLFFIVAITMLCFRSLAQKEPIIRVTGHVSNVQDNPVSNVKIAVAETMTKTSTKKEGTYLVEAPSNGILIFSADGYKTYRVNIAGKNEINPVLTDSIYSKGNNLNEVVVTARAGASMRNKLGTSYSVTNIGYNALSLQAPTSVTETLKSVPGFWVESSGGEAGGNVRARGVPVDGYGSIQLLEDGVPVQHDPALGYLNADQAFRFDETIQSVEVVRGGPASIFYSNAPAGAVNYIPRAVGDKAEGIFKLTVGDGNLFRQDFWVGAPIIDWKLAVGGFYRTGNGARNPGFTGNHGGQFRISLGRKWDKSSFSVDFKRLDDNVTFYLGLPMVRQNGKIVAVPGIDGNYGTIAGQETEKIGMMQGDGTLYNFDNTVGTQVKRSQLSAKFSTEIADNWILKDNFRYSNTTTQRNGVFPNTLQSAKAFLKSQSNLLATVPNAQRLGLQYVTSPATFDTTNQNGNGLMILGGLRGLTLPVSEIDNDLHISHVFVTGNSKHDFNFGYYYSHFEESFNRYSSIALLDVQNNARLLDLVAYDSTGKVAKTFTNNGIYRYGYEYANAHGEQSTNALYLSDEWEVTHNLRFDGGIRWESVQTRGVVEQMKSVNLGTFATSNILTGSGLFQGYNQTFNFTTWTLGADYQFSNKMGAFARYTSAARIPGLGTYVTNVNAVPLTQTMSLGEIGYKYGTDKGYLFATGFYTKYNNVGFTNYIFSTGGTNVPQTLYANSKTFGVELEGGYYPVKWFDISATATLQSAKYEGLVYTNQAGQLINYNGNQLIRIPAISLRAVPGFNFFGDRLRLQAPVEYEGKRYVDVANSVELPGYVKIDINAQVKVNSKISLFGIIDNVNNSLGLTEGNPRQGEVQNADYGASSFIARPLIGRSFKVSLRYKF
jgi:catecholate siderophore receptor